MGNANSGHVQGSAQGTTSRNPLQRGANAVSEVKADPTHPHKSSSNSKMKESSSRRYIHKSTCHKCHSHSDENGSNHPDNTSIQQQRLSSARPSVQVGNGTKNCRSRQVSVTIDSDGPPHQAHQRFVGRLSITDSLSSNYESFVSQTSSLVVKPRLTLGEARELVLAIFFPRQGQLECIASGFLTVEHYALMRGFWAPFLTTELRDKWYLDAVMLSVLGKDRWRSSRPQRDFIMSANPSREQVMQLNEQRRGYSDQLRERLLDLCGSLVESHAHHGKKPNLQLLLEGYNLHKKVHSSSVPGNDDDSTNSIGDRGHDLNTSHEVASIQHKDLLSLSLMRLQTTVSTSFDCFDLLAKRIPTSVISSLPSSYFLNSSPVVYKPIAFQEKKVGDLDAMSFFVSLESRRRLLNGQTSDHQERPMNASFNDLGLVRSLSAFEGTTTQSVMNTTQQFYSAVRHAGLVLTTACSSMVLTVMFQLAEVLRARQVFRDNRAKAAQTGVPLEQLIGREAATINTYSGKDTENLEELKRYAITDEMTLVVLTKLLIKHFKKENQAKMEKLRKRYPNLFAYLEAIAPPEEQEDFDVPRLLSGMVLKLMFLTGGGQRSIVADDQRVPAGTMQITDDVAISNMLEVPILNHICWVACMMGMPIMSNHGILAQKHQGKPLNYIELDECGGVMRALFQAVGALPCGNACPHAFKDWFSLFPFYAVNAEGKRVLMYLYTVQVAAIQRVPLTIQKDMTLLSFASALKEAKGQGRVDIANYFFDPTLTVGYSWTDKDSELSSVSSPFTSPPASPLAPKSIANGIDVPDHHSSANSGQSDNTVPLSKDLNDNASPQAIGNCRSTKPASAGSRAHGTSSKMSPLKSAPHQIQSPLRSTPGQQKDPMLDDQLANTSSSGSPSCSTLLEDDRDVDVYTCVNPQTQLYMRCSNEATLRRHRTTELTPSVSVSYLHSQHEVRAKRPDIAPVLHHAVPKLMPSEGFLVVRWTSAEPLVTFRAGDIISAMVERTSSSENPSGNNDDNGSDALNPPGLGQQCTTSARYFTGAVRPSLDGTAGTGHDGGSLGNKGLSPTAGANLDERSGVPPLASPSRVHTVTIDDSTTRGTSPKVTGMSLSGRVGGIPPADAPFTDLGNTDQNAASSFASSHNTSERACMYQGFMQEFLGVKKVSRRMAMRWKVINVLPSSQLMHRARGTSTAGLTGGAASSKQHQQQYRNEVVLHVAAPEMPVSFPLKVLTIGHERASMSVFTFINPDDSVCWANPRLIEAIANRDENISGNGYPVSVNSSGHFLQASAASQGPGGLLCNTEEELHNVFFSIGVLLSNTIVNGVFFSVPIAPLAFLLMKKALSSGDYSFKSFMWLEPADGNLLSPSLVMNSAYEILTMTEQQYVAFLKSRGMANGDNYVFPVMHSLLDEMRSDKAWQTVSTLPSPMESRRLQFPVSGKRQRRTHGSSTSTSLDMSCTARERSLTASHASLGAHEYVKLIQLHNRCSSTLPRSQLSGSEAVGGASDALAEGMSHSFLMSESVSVQDRLQGYRSQQQQEHEGRPGASDSPEMEALYAKLPSRREYLSLYLVNDLAWGSVRRDDVGKRNKELWVSMARGFMTSAVAKSPLMTNCCSRIIREVLCVPRPDG
ncbi:hypothetical protein ABL78_1176 [Leptomonas seymouri]|uniref:Uncharacterized protein n=1 Tax=Leptomonas seymouri TaxID=5684 RepID=A0A0N1PF07_LEPSE|nr:hypothetical protein ABL78_1176 [Leptomonas seymouri]|eukprot:KPI89683.1 hypothetical protein ABL78_1176 [Leptomonas seymouri]